VKLLDTTVLSNFAHVERCDLLSLTLPDALSTPQVLAELRRGEAEGRLPASDWAWLTIVSLTADEMARFEHIRLTLNDGEASCIAVAIERGGVLYTDDRDARRYARRLGLSVSGTLGVLALLVEGQYLTVPQADALLRAMINFGYYAPVSSLAETCDFGK
jgi:predicted nucleic acid-binding protein